MVRTKTLVSSVYVITIIQLPPLPVVLLSLTIIPQTISCRISRACVITLGTEVNTFTCSSARMRLRIPKLIVHIAKSLSLPTILT